MLSLFFINKKVGISFFEVSRVNIKISPFFLSLVLHIEINLFISLKSSKWIVCLINIKSNLFLLFSRYLIASIFLKSILLSLSLWISISIPIGLFFNLSLEDKDPNILPLTQPISKIWEFEFNLICFSKNILNDWI